jgi:hypothetical protein
VDGRHRPDNRRRRHHVVRDEEAKATAASVEPLAFALASRWEALGGDNATAIEAVASLLHEPAQAGALYGLGYNTGYLVVIGEPPPIGERPAHLEVPSAAVEASPNALLEIDYSPVVPTYLSHWRERYASMAASHDAALEQFVAGPPDLREMWKESWAAGVTNWGGDSLASFTQEFYAPFHQ